MSRRFTIRCGDSLEVLREVPSETVSCCVTSPPYWGLRDYGGGEKEIGLEQTLPDYIENLVKVFREVRRTLRDDGTLWLNLDDCYATQPPGGGGGPWANRTSQARKVADKVKREFDVPQKNLIGVPWQVAFALQADGWYLRSDIIWSKEHGLKNGARDRPLRTHEMLFLLSKSPRYRFHPDFRGHESVWTVRVQRYEGSHFAVMPVHLVEKCITAGCRKKGIVLDPFCGSGTVGVAARRTKRKFIGIDLNPAYCALARQRIDAASLSVEDAKRITELSGKPTQRSLFRS